MQRKSARRLKLQIVVDHPVLSVAELQEILVVKPDESWHRGDAYKPSPLTENQNYKFSRWALTETASSLDELSEAIQALLKRIEPHVNDFAQLPDDSRVALTLFIDEKNTVIGTGFDRDVVQFLAKINAEIDISLLVHGA